METSKLKKTIEDAYGVQLTDMQNRYVELQEQQVWVLHKTMNKAEKNHRPAEFWTECGNESESTDQSERQRFIRLIKKKSGNQKEFQ